MKKRLIEQAKLVAGIHPSAQTAGSVNGILIDRQGFLDAIVHLKVGAAMGAPTEQGVSLKIQHGDAADGADMADIADATIGPLINDNAESYLNLDLSGLKRYIRAVITTAFTGGTAPSIPVAVTVALGNSNTEPVD